MATYGTDLVLVATGSDGSGGTWGEFVGWDSGGTPSSEAENFIQGAASYSQTFGNAVTGKSIAFDAGSDISSSIPSGDVVMGWVFIGAATNLYSYASGGWRFGIGTDLTNFDMWYISGDDRPPNPYGGWWNVAVDPRHATDATAGTGSGGAWRYFGSLIGDTTLGIRAKIAKGSPHAVDGLLRGRGEIYCTGTGATFTLMAAQNDLVANRWGLLQDTGGGTFLWKGLMSFGQTGTSTTFSDSNKTIVIDDCPKTYAAFNKIEFNHVDTNVTLTNISFAPKGTYAPGNLEMIDDCTVAITGCTFNNMGTFIFDSNATVVSTIFNGCGLVTQAGGTFDSCTFDSSTSTSTITVDNLDLISDCRFISDGSNYALNLGTVATTTAIQCDNFFTNYATSDGSTGNEAIAVTIQSPNVLTINVGVGYDTPYVHKTGTGTVTVVSSVDVTITVKDKDGNLLTGVQTAVYRTSDRFEIMNEDTVAGVATTGYSGTKPVEVEVRCRKASSTDPTRYKNFSSVQTITNTGLTLAVTMLVDPNNNATE